MSSSGLYSAETLVIKKRDHYLTARRIHDARHAAAALAVGIQEVYTYDVDDWHLFETDGLKVAGPESALVRSEDASGR